MALQSLTTTPTPSGTETVAPKPGPQDTNANGSLLGQPLVPAFVLSGLLVVGIVMMCWWKRLAARRMFLRLNTGAGVGAEGTTTTPGMGEGGGSTGSGYAYSYPVPRTTLMIGPGRVMGPGMLLLATRGADLQAEALTYQALGGPAGGRRKKEVKLGPKPVLWDVHLGENEEKKTGERWRWDDLKPLSASYVPPQSSSLEEREARTQEAPSNTNNHNPIAASRSTDEPRTLPGWLRRRRAEAGPVTEAQKISEGQPESSPSPPKMRISMVISMPTREGGRRARPVRTEDSECNLKAVGNGEPPVNLALGIAEVEERKELKLCSSSAA